MAGLGAAHALIACGCDDILILEAQREPGGRILTLEIGEGVIEMGAQWLHTNTHFLYDIAEKHNLIHNEKSDEGLGLFIRDDGVIIDDKLVKTVGHQVDKILDECGEFVNNTYYPKSVGDFLEAKFNHYINSSDDPDDVKEMKIEIFNWHILFQVIDNSCNNLQNVSAKQWGKYSCMGKNRQAHINIKNGYKALVNILVESLPKNIIKLQTPVLKINYLYETKVKLLCENNFEVLADHVIVTSSIGYLQKNYKQFFYPPLPKETVQCIKSIGFDGLGKIYLLFDKKWWPSEGIQFIWRKTTNLSQDEIWTKYITGFDSVLDQPNMLLGWVGGPGVKLMENLSDELIGKHCISLFKRFLPRLDIPKPIKIVR